MGFQAISNIARHNFAVAHIDAYKLPLGLLVAQVEDHEKRVAVPNGPGRLKAYVYNKKTEVWKVVVPDDVGLVRLHQLTLGLDSGPQGRVAGNFAKHHLKYNVCEVRRFFKKFMIYNRIRFHILVVFF